MIGRLGALALVVRRSLRQHALSSVVTVASTGLGCGLVMAVFALSQQSRAAFAGGPIGFDAVLGAKGSELQLVLNTVFHLETSPGNVPWSLYEQVRDDRRVSLAIPYALGDNFEGFRVVGTTPEIFTEHELDGGRRLEPAPGGRAFDPALKEAVIGATVARETGLTLGSHFNPSHGAVESEGHEHEEEYLVVGVLEPTNTPSDRVVWIPIEGVFRMEGHVLRGTGERYVAEHGAAIPDEHKEVSAVMLRFRSPQAGFQLQQTLSRQGTVATLAWPIGKSVAELFDKLGWVSRILGLVAYLVVAVAAASILASIYNAMNERRREFAILRALGARRWMVSSAIVAEAGTIAALGGLFGFVVYGAILAVARGIVERQTGVVLDLTAYHPALWATPAGMVVLGALCGLIPAFKAYATDVASNLQPTS